MLETPEPDRRGAKRITELSTNVVSPQEVLTDKRSRGARSARCSWRPGAQRDARGQFFPAADLSNGTRVDCLLTLPQPTGDVPIDMKFPLESFQTMMNNELAETDWRGRCASSARISANTSATSPTSTLSPARRADGAVMFLPAEAIFAEIHAHFPDLVEEAQQARLAGVTDHA